MKKTTFIFLLISLLASLYSQEIQKTEYQISQKYVLFQVIDNRIRVREIINIDTDMWDLPAEFEFVEKLPENIVDFHISISDNYTFSGGKLVAQMNSDNKRVIDFTYTYYINDLSSQLYFSSNYQVQNLDIFIPVEMGIELSDPLLIADGTYSFGEKIYLHYKIEQLPKRKIIKPQVLQMKEELISQYSRLSKKSPTFHSAGHIRLWYQTPFKKINPHIFTLIIIVLFFAALYLIIRKNVFQSRMNQQDSQKSDILFAALFSKKQNIFNKIMDLEHNLQNEIIDEDYYNATKDQLKSQLIKINVKLDQFVNRDQDKPDDTV